MKNNNLLGELWKHEIVGKTITWYSLHKNKAELRKVMPKNVEISNESIWTLEVSLTPI